MKLYNFVNETTQEEVVSQEMDEIIEKVKKHCKPFLKEFDILHNPVWRGTNRKMVGDTHFLTARARKNRRPKDLPQHLHNLLDDMFFKKFGWKPRSEGVFVTHNRSAAGNFGWQTLFFPKAKYQYVWNPVIDDIYQSIKTDIVMELPHIDDNLMTRDIEPKHVNDEFEILLEDMIDGYKNNHYNNETGKTEAMFKVYEYYMVAFDTQREDKQFLVRLKDAL